MREELSEAIRREQLRLYFQPAYSLADATIGSAEALMRWDHPGHGILSPSEFIAVAERSDLIAELGDWAIEQTCSQLARWRNSLEQAELYVTVNVSRAQLDHSDPIESLREAAQRTEAPLSRLALEFPGAALPELSEEELEHLARLGELGAALVIDNVSDPECLLEPAPLLPVRALRIAGNIVSGLPEAEVCVTLAGEILEVAAKLGVQTIAQGVESPAQVQALRELGCDYAAGFLFAVPMPAAQIEDALRGQVRPAGDGNAG
jgi:EAL domain-containing protein (putative c-di-GMP-specific phosphodiesterase class I)